MTTYLLNLFDLACTLYALSIGLTELNPIMQNIPFMVFYKTVIVGVLLLWLSRRTERIAHVGINLCTAVYVALCIYHIFGFFLIGGI